MRYSIGKGLVKRGLWLLIIIFISIYALFMISRFQLMAWDEAVYLGMGKHIYSSGTSGLWESIRPPMLPMILGLFWKLHLPYIVSAKVIMMLFAIGSSILCYLIAKEMDKKAALIAAAVALFTPMFFNSSLQVLTELPGAFFALLSFYLYIKGRFGLSGVAAFMSFMTKYYNGLFFAAIAVSIVYEKKFRERFAFLASFMLLALAVMTIYHFQYGSAIDPFLKAGMHQNNPVHALQGIASNITFYPVALLAAPFLYLSFFAGWNKKTIPIYLIILFYSAYLLYIPNKQVRFAASFTPFMAILAAVAFIKLKGRLDDASASRKKKAQSRFFGHIAWFAFILAFAFMLYADVLAIMAFPGEKPALVSEFHEYPYFGRVLTMDPVPAAYSDALFVHYYNNATDALAIYKEESYDILIYNPSALACFDSGCESAKAELRNLIMSENRLILNRTSDGFEKYILVPVNNTP